MSRNANNIPNAQLRRYIALTRTLTRTPVALRYIFDSLCPSSFMCFKKAT